MRPIPKVRKGFETHGRAGMVGHICRYVARSGRCTGRVGSVLSRVNIAFKGQVFYCLVVRLDRTARMGRRSRCSKQHHFVILAIGIAVSTFRSRKEIHWRQGSEPSALHGRETQCWRSVVEVVRRSTAAWFVSRRLHDRTISLARVGARSPARSVYFSTKGYFGGQRGALSTMAKLFLDAPERNSFLVKVKPSLRSGGDSAVRVSR